MSDNNSLLLTYSAHHFSAYYRTAVKVHEGNGLSHGKPRLHLKNPGFTGQTHIWLSSESHCWCNSSMQYARTILCLSKIPFCDWLIYSAWHDLWVHTLGTH